MATDDMERVLVELLVENLEDIWRARSGQIREDEIRHVTVTDALVDTGTTTLSLPTSIIPQLGLQKRDTQRVTNSAGAAKADMYDAVRLTIQGRDCTVDVMEVPNDVPMLVGQIPLEVLDLIVDTRSRSLVGNPAHDGEHIIELS